MSYRLTFAHRASVVGNSWTLSELARGIRRTHGKCAPGSKKLAKVLGEKLDELAARRWARATKGQRTPTPRQAIELATAINDALAGVQSRNSARLIAGQDVVLAAREADVNGFSARDGGKVTCGNYGYAWSTTTAMAERIADGTIDVKVSRSGSQHIAAPAKHWQSITLAVNVLKGGGVVGIRRKHGFDCYAADGSMVAVAVEITDKAVKNRFGTWEHGATIAEAAAEIVRKRQLIDAEDAAREAAKRTAEAEAKHAARIDRAARLLARIGRNITVGYDDARAAGACDAGLRAFANRIGLPIESRLPLAEVCKLEPAWAVKMARRIVVAKAIS